MKLNAAVMYGSRTCEHDVSIISGLQAAEATERAGHTVTRIYIGRDGTWYVGEALKDIEFYRHFDAAKVTHVLPVGEKGKLTLLKYPDGKKSLFGSDKTVIDICDVAIPVFHGMNGEDGTLQGMLELMDVPYTSAGVLGSAVGMDKIAMKLFFKGCGFPVVPGEWVNRDHWENDRAGTLDRLEKALPYPMFVKPANLGSSIGIKKAKDREGLEDALDVAASYDRRILIEKGVSQLKEINCSVLGYGDDVRAAVLEMPVSTEELLSFDGKYLQSAKGGSKGMQSLSRQVPAPIGEEKTKFIQSLAIEVFRSLDCKGVVRIDFILDESDDSIYVNEINIIPGSLAFYLWEKDGVSFADLMDKMIEFAFKANADKKKSIFSYDSQILNRQGGTMGSKGKLSK